MPMVHSTFTNILPCSVSDGMKKDAKKSDKSEEKKDEAPKEDADKDAEAEKLTVKLEDLSVKEKADSTPSKDPSEGDTEKKD